MTTTYRRRRGAETQAVVAAYFRGHGWPWVQDAGAGRSGSDLLGVPGLDVEIRARRELQLTSWLKDTAKRAAEQHALPLLIVRPDGMGPASLEDWPVVMRLADIVQLLNDGGYGDPAAKTDEP